MDLATEILQIFEEIENYCNSFEDMCKKLCEIKHKCQDYVDGYMEGSYEEYISSKSE